MTCGSNGYARYGYFMKYSVPDSNGCTIALVQSEAPVPAPPVPGPAGPNGSSPLGRKGDPGLTIARTPRSPHAILASAIARSLTVLRSRPNRILPATQPPGVWKNVFASCIARGKGKLYCAGQG